jgi:hypothetical protein
MSQTFKRSKKKTVKNINKIRIFRLSPYVKPTPPRVTHSVELPTALHVVVDVCISYSSSLHSRAYTLLIKKSMSKKNTPFGVSLCLVPYIIPYSIFKTVDNLWITCG